MEETKRSITNEAVEVLVDEIKKKANSTDLALYATNADLDAKTEDKAKLDNTATSGKFVAGLSNDLGDEASFGFDEDTIYFSVDGAQNQTYTKSVIDDKVGFDDLATDQKTGVILTDPDSGIETDSNGKLVVSGRIGEFDGTLGYYLPNDREPRYVNDYSLLMTDAKGINMQANRALAIVSGFGISCQSAPAGSTVYRLTNNYENRLTAKMAENGYVSKDEATSNTTIIEPVLSVTINGQSFTPDSSPNDSSNPIEITVANSVNPDSAITNIRLFGLMSSYASAHIGNGVASWAAGRSLLIGGGITKAAGNDNCLVGQHMYVSGNGNAVFGRQHVVRKNRGFFAGTGHDSTNAKSESASAIGQWSKMDSGTLFAVGNGTSHVARSNAFEIRESGQIKSFAPAKEDNDLVSVSYLDSAGLRLNNNLTTNSDILSPWSGTLYNVPNSWAAASTGTGTVTVVDADSDVPVAVSKMATISGNTSGNKDLSYCLPSLKAGTYTMSIYVKAAGKFTLQFRVWDVAGNKRMSVYSVANAEAQTWRRVSYTFTTSEDMTTPVSLFFGVTGNTNGDVSYCAPQLSKGSMSVYSAGADLIVTSPNGTRYKIVVDNNGTLSTELVS